MHMTAVLMPAEKGGFVALNPETGTATQGDTFDDAMRNLREAVALYLEDVPVEAEGATIITSFDIEPSDVRPAGGPDDQTMRALIEEGLASGIIDADPSDVIREIMAERPARRG
ncbi:MAG: type II toxin-antitoxin system HicB family antitoxin [Sphingomonadaceae bacterium]